MRLSESQLKQYDADGFLIVHNVFTKHELEPLQAEIDQLVDDLAQRLKKAGKITNLHEDKGFLRRFPNWRIPKPIPSSGSPRRATFR